MTLESTIVCIDTSEYMRNGDFSPTRLEAQIEAVTMVCNNKLNANAESTVALMSMSGEREVLVTLTTDIAKIMSAMHGIKPAGRTDFTSGVQVATLVLKHRQSKNHRQRIVVFVGSPMDESAKDLEKLGKKLKKNNVAVDIINFGEEELNTPKLEAFIAAVNKDDTSHLITVPSGAQMLTDALMGSPIVAGEGGATGGSASFAEYGGFDPSLDPEMAMAMRASMMEQHDRQKGPESADQGAPMQTDMPIDETMDPELANAIKLSLTNPTEDAVMDTAEDDAEEADDVDLAGMTEEQQIEYALRMSMGPAAAEPKAASSAPAAPSASAAAPTPAAQQQDALAAVLSDPNFLQEMFGGLSGVDPNSPDIQAVLKNLQGEGKKDDDKDDAKKDDSK